MFKIIYILIIFINFHFKGGDVHKYSEKGKGLFKNIHKREGGVHIYIDWWVGGGADNWTEQENKGLLTAQEIKNESSTKKVSFSKKNVLTNII